MNAMQRLIDADAVARLRDRDASLFSDDPETQALVANRLGWTTLASEAPDRIGDLEVLLGLMDGTTTDVCLLGMGGSSLAALVMGSLLAERRRVADAARARHHLAVDAGRHARCGDPSRYRMDPRQQVGLDDRAEHAVLDRPSAASTRRLGARQRASASSRSPTPARRSSSSPGTKASRRRCSPLRPWAAGTRRSRCSVSCPPSSSGSTFRACSTRRATPRTRSPHFPLRGTPPRSSRRSWSTRTPPAETSSRW